METTNNKKEQYEAALKRVKEIKGFYVHLLVYLVVNLMRLFINTGPDLRAHLTDPLTYLTALSWGVGLGVHGLLVFGPGIFLGKNWEARKIRELMEKERSAGGEQKEDALIS